LDIGEKRTGVAVSDVSGKIATPVSVIATDELLAGGKGFVRVLEDYDPVLVVIGLPVSMDGGEHAQAARVREVARRIGELYGLPYEFTGERLSSKEARQAMREMGHSERTMRGKLDMIAATLFLQAYLDQKGCQQNHE
jgi:putative Holliday junction resolvase